MTVSRPILRNVRYLRHVARVLLIALLIPTASLNPEGSLIPTNAHELHAIVSNPLYLPFIGVMAVIAHFGLVKWKGIRGHWDWGLEKWRLRPKGLPT